VDVSLLSAAFAVPRLLVLAGLITALSFAIARRRTLGRAATPAITGICLLIADFLFGLTLPAFGLLAERVDLPNYMAGVAAHSFASAVLWGAGLALVIVAVFVGRKSVTPDPGQPAPPAGPLP
jgi:hypothetical protein